MTRIEHANITVPDLDAATAFLAVVAPDFVVRHEDRSSQGYRWRHVGNAQCYFALQEPQPGSEAAPALGRYAGVGVNHFGLEVSGLEAMMRRLDAEGYARSYPVQREPGRLRAYFYDRAGFEWELIEYSTDDPAQRYRYDS